MPFSYKDKSADKVAAVVSPPLRVSKLPQPLRFPLLVVLSLSLSSLLYPFAARYTAGQLAAVSRSLNEWWEISALVTWRIIELALGWFGNYDSYDLAALSLLSHGPPLYFLYTFYPSIRFTTVLSSLIIDILATSIPFRLLRPLSRAHASSGSSRSLAVPNREIITDITIQILTTILAASIYSIILGIAYAASLPVILVTHFDIPSIAAAHDATTITILPTMLAFGLAACVFIFAPTTAEIASPADAKGIAFNPVTATLAETFRHNVWGYSPRTKTLIIRTLTLMAITGFNTFIQLSMTIEGADAVGAAAYAGVWVIAALVTGVSLGVVGAV